MRSALALTNPPSSFLARDCGLQAAASFLRSKGIVIYPTETWPALGCRANDAKSIESVIKIKKRPPGKSLPLIAASMEQAEQYCDLSKAPEELLAFFWPGPLTLVLPARGRLHPALLDRQGRIAIRVSSSKSAASLARDCGAPLTASSANISGRPPRSDIEDLDPELLHRFALCKTSGLILTGRDEKRFSQASTIVEPCPGAGGKAGLRILREGAITEAMLKERNFNII